ncbi:phage gp6-like head-tail connector protein [Muribacter muris]|uniref:Phage gp6-like head-tail connector protein n=1 Tax=Muribacter muris TaxID=67855 RepID=A0A4Y9JQG9_9PAST|nr:head-tail connector protein [Muribacter muris]MBF0786101.1 phage gp6-like head-tail connector protein [Muribacter muris]MBF0826478.1 phage gp6-like head-tail connector protein [Muribacter muris]TFV07941.1 phage gp6-like head-tail connector protein [Muribacter muris]
MSKPIIPLEEIKAHLRIEHDLDDELLTLLADSALEAAQHHIGKTWGEENTDKTVIFTKGVKVGCLMFIGHLYANREAVADIQLHQVPLAISSLWNVHRELGIC